jgi:hypothetical protein
VTQRVAELAAFVDAARRLRRDVAGDAARKRELPEQDLQAGFVARDRRVNLGVSAFEVGVGHQRRSAVARTRDVNHLDVVLGDHAVQMGVDEVLSRRGAPMSEQPRLDVFEAQRVAQQRVVEQIDLPD